MLADLALPAAILLGAAIYSAATVRAARAAAVTSLGRPPCGDAPSSAVDTAPPKAPEAPVVGPEPSVEQPAAVAALHRRMDALRVEVAQVEQQRDAARGSLAAEMNGGELRREILNEQIAALRRGDHRPDLTGAARVAVLQALEDERDVRQLRAAAGVNNDSE